VEHSPDPSRPHAKADGLIQLWLGTYAARHPDTEVLANALEFDTARVLAALEKEG
jgi:hypothetical protein